MKNNRHQRGSGLDLLAEPVDAELLHEYSEKLQKKIKAPRGGGGTDRNRPAPSPDKTLLATSSTKVSYDRFSRFAHRCRLAALDDYPRATEARSSY